VGARVPYATVVLTRSGNEIASWALMGAQPVDLELVDEVARWQLAARRLGCSIWLRDADRHLLDLLELVGLGVEVCRQAEGGEQVRVEEAVEPGDPFA
jgi:hypothetical protein